MESSDICEPTAVPGWAEKSFNRKEHEGHKGKNWKNVILGGEVFVPLINAYSRLRGSFSPRSAGTCHRFAFRRPRQAGTRKYVAPVGVS